LLGTIPWTLQGYDISTEMVLSIRFLISLVWHAEGLCLVLWLLRLCLYCQRCEIAINLLLVDSFGV
jgi:hypothetical protein